MQAHANSQSKLTSGKPREELWKKFLDSRAVTAKAIDIFLAEENGYFSRCPESENYFGFYRAFDGRRVWDTMADTEKAPFITAALRDLYPVAKVWKIESKKPKDKKYFKSKAKEVDAEALDIFCMEVVEDYIKEKNQNQNVKIPPEFLDEVYRKWPKMSDADKARYLEKARKCWRIVNPFSRLYSRVRFSGDWNYNFSGLDGTMLTFTRTFL